MFLERAAKAAACLALLFVLTVSSLTIAAAAGVGPAYEILHTLYPEIAEKLIPVKVSCVDNGIKMSVEAIYVYDDSADIYLG